MERECNLTNNIILEEGIYNRLASNPGEQSINAFLAGLLIDYIGFLPVLNFSGPLLVSTFLYSGKVILLILHVLYIFRTRLPENYGLHLSTTVGAIYTRR